MITINLRKILGVLLILSGVGVIAFAPVLWATCIEPSFPQKWFETVQVYDSQSEKWELVTRPFTSIAWAYFVTCATLVVNSVIFGVICLKPEDYR